MAEAKPRRATAMTHNQINERKGLYFSFRSFLVSRAPAAPAL